MLNVNHIRADSLDQPAKFITPEGTSECSIAKLIAESAFWGTFDRNHKRLQSAVRQSLGCFSGRWNGDSNVDASTDECVGDIGRVNFSSRLVERIDPMRNVQDLHGTLQILRARSCCAITSGIVQAYSNLGKSVSIASSSVQITIEDFRM
jgi:hypothetical protein